jgi:CDGSH-type Zn-finger protein
MATIKVRQNGSLLVDGDDVTLIDWNGNPYTLAKRPFALCRCGHSTNKPFCDGTHSKIGFQAGEAAIGPEAVDRPADQTKPPDTV